MAVKKNIAIAPKVDTKKPGKTAEQPVAVEEQAKEVAKKQDKHNHDLERTRNAKVIQLKAVDAKGGKGKKEDLSMLESSLVASARAKAAKNKPSGKVDKKKKSIED